MTQEQLEALKLEVKTPYNLAQMQRFDDAENAVDWLINHLAPRIVREGCVVVPVEPTDEMIEAFFNLPYDFDFTGSYKAMIAAAKGD